MIIIIVFRLGCDRPSGLLLFVPAVFFSMLMPLFCPSSSVSLSHSFWLFPCAGVRESTCARVPHFWWQIFMHIQLFFNACVIHFLIAVPGEEGLRGLLLFIILLLKKTTLYALCHRWFLLGCLGVLPLRPVTKRLDHRWSACKREWRTHDRVASGSGNLEAWGRRSGVNRYRCVHLLA